MSRDKEAYNKYMREWRLKPKNNKKVMIYEWKRNGLKGDYDSIYNEWLNETNCQTCNVVLEGKGINKKCMEHNHMTGEFRGIVCHNCNMKLCVKSKNNTSGHNGISYVKKKKLWKYRKMINNKTYQKMCKCKITLLTYKFCYLLLLNKK